jgi:hypothetical protein
MKTPRYGSTIVKMIQPAFPQPERSSRRKMSAKTVKRIHSQRSHRKNTIIVQKTSRNG